MVRREILSTGARLLVREMRSAPVVALNLWVGSGSAGDPDDLPGLSHFIEHLLFRGGPDVGSSDVTRKVQEAGGYLNAETGCDYTVYHQIVPSDRWEDVLSAQVRASSSPAFTAPDLESERAVIIEEARSAESDPATFVWRRLMGLTFGGHPYGRPVVGTVESLSRATRSDLSAHHARNYVQGNMVQVIVGDVNADAAISQARALLDAVPSGPGPEPVSVQGRAGGGLRVLRYEGEIAQPYVAVAFAAPHALHMDVPALDALCGLLGVGRSSRLRKALRTEAGVVSDIGAGVVGYRGAGLLVVRAVATTPDVETVIAGAFREIARLCSDLPSPAEMEKNLRRLESGYVLAHETADSVAHSLGYFETLGDYSYAEEYVDRLAAVTTDDILRVAERYLSLERACVVCYVPGAQGGPVVDRSDAVAEAVLKATSSATGRLSEPRAPWKPSSFARPVFVREATARRCEARRLREGGRLVAFEDRGLPIVSLALAFEGGFPDEPEGREGITYLMQKMAMLGTRSRSADEVADEIEELGTGVTSAVDRDGLGWGLTVVSRHLNAALSVLGDVIGAPSFPSDRLAAAKAEVRAEIGEIEDHPVQRAMLRLLPLVFPGRSYGRPVRGTRESIDVISAADLAGWHERVCAPARMVACTVGDASAEAAREAIDSALVMEREGAPPHEHRAVGGPGAPRGALTEDLARSPQSVLAIGLAGPSAGTRDAVVARVVVGALSMMGGRLWTALRERPPHAYHVGAVQIAYRMGGATVGYATSPPGREKSTVDAFLLELDRLAGKGLDAPELERARRHLAGTIEISLMRGATRAAGYAMAEVSGAGYAYIEGLPNAVRTVTNEEVIDVSRRYLAPGRGLATVILKGDSRLA